MRILMLSWEYPPKVIGGLARAVADLSQALVDIGHEVAVVTGDWPQCGTLQYLGGVRVHRVNQFFPRPREFLDEVHFINGHLIQKSIELFHKLDYDLIHAHDWLVAPSAKVLKHAFQKPLIATIHATEWGRNNGLHTDLQRHISDLEWWLTYEAHRVICCSEYMQRELVSIFQTPADKLTVIPNGVRAADFSTVHDDLNEWRRSWALPEERIVLYVGRHVFEKGIDLLISSAPEILQRHPQAKFIVAGTGPCTDELKRQAWDLGLGQKVLFPGFIDDVSRNSLYHLADAAVFPSRYEPFGIVALEAMAARAAVVVSDVGGFRETVQHLQNGLTFYAGNIDSLRDSILMILDDPALTGRLKEKAFRDVTEKYDWEQIARETTLCYAQDRHYDHYQVSTDFFEKGERLRESSNHGRR